ncbi:hypothetical protein PR003_g7967 [Phytophthora rubi]|uniref:Secreted protein n=1 Tax=Phytophthora rubi TaxID=129364 RepID=A0A6A3JIM0_9STRA|nr:hypothetical protein PR002_g20582 [Phytophthora rubi]KAE9039823.1 hypothetical protein PR001_g7352 [Phytophthora rubi]KAE9345406.1 hypothetical protein PR003_g7967 [Phytophthora rubi]
MPKNTPKVADCLCKINFVLWMFCCCSTVQSIRLYTHCNFSVYYILVEDFFVSDKEAITDSCVCSLDFYPHDPHAHHHDAGVGPSQVFTKHALHFVIRRQLCVKYISYTTNI